MVEIKEKLLITFMAAVYLTSNLFVFVQIQILDICLKIDKSGFKKIARQYVPYSAQYSQVLDYYPHLGCYIHN